MKSGIYSITNLVNNKIYIGSAVNIKKRWGDHRYCFLKNKHHNSHFQSAWNLYGESNFKFDVVEYCDVSELKSREKYYINFFNSNNTNLGYNINDPDNGFLGIKHTKETKKKLSLQKTGNKNPMFGLTGSAHHNFQKPMSDEQKLKISKNRKGKGGMKGESSPVSKLTISDVQYIRENQNNYTRIQLANKFNVSKANIINIVKNRSWTHI